MKLGKHVAETQKVIGNQNLFTIIVDYDGNTFVEQLLCDNQEHALNKWLCIFSESKLVDLIELNELESQLKEDNDLILLNGMKNIWCTSVLLKKGLGLIHVIQTER